jgi:hypothetical protein
MGIEPAAMAVLVPGEQEPAEVEVGQQGRDHALNAKGNFVFERRIEGWRGGLVLDLRRKK